MGKAIESIMDIARWAPSGDNAQPWTFRIRNDREVLILGRRENPNVYEYRNGEPTLISLGALLENISIAAPAFGLKASWRYGGSARGVDHLEVSFADNDTRITHDLFSEITRRSVDRRPFKMSALSDDQKGQLSASLDRKMTVDWHDKLSRRSRIAGLSALATNIRLAIPEAFEVHRGIVDWENEKSDRAIPSRSLGLDPLTLKITRWSMASWSRTKLMNALGAPFFASIQMDLVPGLFCASYFVIRLDRRSRGQEDALVETIEAGQAIQRFWLTATSLGLVIQPCVAILAFWTYAASGREFTVFQKAANTAHKLATRARAIFGDDENIIFIGRIGRPRSQGSSRSTRLPLKTLLRAV